MRDFIAEAIRFAIITEKKSYDLYRKAAMTAPDKTAKKIFERLACEESKHIDALLREHPGTWCSPLQQQTDPLPGADAHLREPQSSVLFEQLRVALLEKRWSMDLYKALMKTFREPSICSVFEVALGFAREEFRLITEEYLQAEQPPSNQKINQRPRRTHVRGGLTHSSPNKHSELFFSMLDSGRQSQLG